MTNNNPTFFSGIRTRLANIELKDLFLFTIGAYFLVGMHYMQLHHGGSGLDIPINPIGWIIISVLIALGIIQIAKIEKVAYSSFFIALSIGCFVLLVPLLFTSETSWYSHTRLLGLFAGLGVIFAVMQMKLTTNDYYKILKYILIAVLIESLISLIQFYILPYQSYININMARPSAIFVQANVAATFLTTGLLISLYLIQHDVDYKHSKLYSALLYITPLTATVAIVLLQSRTGFIAAIVGSAILLLSKSHANKKWLLTVTVGIIVALTSLSSLERHTRDSEVYKNPGVRTQIYQDSFDLILEQPVWGHGYGSFRRIFHENQIKLSQTESEYKPVANLSHPHNEILLWLVEGGLTALIAIIIVGGAIIFLIKQQKSTRYAKFALLFPLAFHTLTELPFYHSVASWLLFILLLSFMANTNHRRLNIAIPRPAPFKLLATVIVLTTTVQMISLLYSQKIITQVYITKKPSVLLDVKLPFISSGFERTLNETKLKISLKMNLDNEVRSYVAWAIRQTSVAPKITHYKNLIIANLYLNNITQAQELQIEASYLFPAASWLESAKLISDKQQQINKPQLSIDITEQLSKTSSGI